MYKHKLGVSYSPYPFNGNAEEGFRLFSSIGFDTTFTMFNPEKGASEISAYAKLADRCGIAIDSLHAPFHRINDMWSEDVMTGDSCLRELCDCIEACASFGIPTAVVHLSSGENAPYINDIGHSRFDRLIECAVKNGVVVAFENQRKIANLAFVLELYRDVPQVGFCWDVGHEACFARGIEFMPLFGDRLVYTHIHDNFAVHNEDSHLIPFDGALDFEKAARHIKRSPYNGSLTLELAAKASAGTSPLDFYTKAFKAISKIRNMIEKPE